MGLTRAFLLAVLAAGLTAPALAQPIPALPAAGVRQDEDARLLAAVRPLIGAIDVEAMQAANLSVDRDVDKLRPDQAARDLARAAGLE